MKENSKGDHYSRLHDKGKGTNYSHIVGTVKGLFSSGRKLTAIEINSITGSNDARKVISMLRSKGWSIADRRLDDGCKLYWLANPANQLSLFQEGGHND